jgi:ABC-type taurine transport system substrate-binding protein
LLRVSAIDSKGLQLLSLDTTSAADALRRGDIDAAFMVANIDAPVVRALLSAPETTAVRRKGASTTLSA